MLREGREIWVFGAKCVGLGFKLQESVNGERQVELVRVGTRVGL